MEHAHDFKVKKEKNEASTYEKKEAIAYIRDLAITLNLFERKIFPIKFSPNDCFNTFRYFNEILDFCLPKAFITTSIQILKNY